MKIEFLPTEKPDVKILTGYMNLSEEFLKLEKEDQEVLVWALLKQPEEMEELIEMWRDEYQDKFRIKINSSELLMRSKSAIALLKKIPLNIREFISTSQRLKVFMVIVNLKGSFSSHDVKTCGLESSETMIQYLLKALCYRGMLRRFKVKRIGQPLILYEKVGGQKNVHPINDVQEKRENIKKQQVLKMDSIELKNLLKFMKGSNDFQQLDNEDQCILLLSILKHPNTTEYLIDSWEKDYTKKSMQINTTALCAHVKEAITLCGSALVVTKESVEAGLLRKRNICNTSHDIERLTQII